MKPIVKNSEPQQFSKWKAQGGASRRWDDVRGRIKTVVQRALMDEQGHICCYCESLITATSSHVEHFRPRSQFRSRELDYRNLHCSCLRDPVRGEPIHCGHKKGNWFDRQLLVSPLQKNCDRRFTFSPNGEIRPRRSNDLAAAMTIKRLGLDLPKLQRGRAAAVRARRRLPRTQIKAALVKDRNGRFPPYFTTIEDVLL